MITIRNITGILAHRCMDMLPKGTKAYNLAEAIILNQNNLPIDKLSRWLGFVQATCIFEGYTTIDAERDFSRPLFHEAYTEMGIDIPETFNA